MSTPNHHESLLERHWYVLLILFGVLFFGCIDIFGKASYLAADPHTTAAVPSTVAPPQSPPSH